MIPAVRVLRPCPVRSSFPDWLAGLVALCPGPGRGGPRPDMAVTAEHAAGNAGVRAGSLQAPHRFGADADHMVTVADRVSGGLDPGHPRMPGPVPLMLLPAQQMPDPVPGQLHDRRRPRLAAIQLPTLSSHTPKIRNDVLHNKRPRAGPAIRRCCSAQRGIHARPASRPAARCRRMKTQATWLAAAPGTWSRPSRAGLTQHSSRRKTRPRHPTPSGDGITALSGPAGARLTRRMITVLGRGTISWPGTRRPRGVAQIHGRGQPRCDMGAFMSSEATKRGYPQPLQRVPVQPNFRRAPLSTDTLRAADGCAWRRDDSQ